MAGRTHASAIAATLLVLVANACTEDTVTPPSDGSKPPPGAGPDHLGVVEVTIRWIGTETPSATAISASSVAALERLRAERRADAGPGGALAALGPLPGGDGTIQLEPVSTGAFTEGVRGADGVRYLYATFRVRNAQRDGTPYTTARQNLTFLSVDTDQTYGQTAISRLRLFDGTTLPDATGTPMAEGMTPTGQVARNTALQIVSSGADVLQVFQESEVDPGVINPPAGVETVFPYGFMVRHEISTSTRALPADPAPGDFSGVVTFAFKVPLQPTAADDAFEISAVFLAMDDSDTHLTQSFEEQNPAGRAALEDRAASLGVNRVNLLPGSSYGGPIPAHLLCRVRTAGTAVSPSTFLANMPAELASLSPDPYATDGSGSRITVPTSFEASFSTAVDGADANTFVVHGRHTGRRFLAGAYSGNGTATVTSPQAGASAFFPGEEIELSLTMALAACPPHVAHLRVAVNAGSGTFDTPVSYHVVDAPTAIAVGDLDGDGDLDIATATLFSSASVLLNTGTGTFGTAVNYNTGSAPGSVALGDLDGDGDLDIITGNRTSDDLSVLLNNGNATFATAVNYTTGDSPEHIALGDLDGDGDLDIAVANRGSDDVSVLLNNGNATFATAVKYNTGDAPSSIALGDLDGDGDLDIATTTYPSSASVLLNTGTGTFATAVNYNTGDPSSSLALGDLDADGDPDIATANGRGNVSVLLNNGSGTFAAPVIYNTGGTPRRIALGDLDGDGDLDAVAAIQPFQAAEDVSVLLNNGNGTFAAAVSYDGGPNARDIALGDLDGDGDLDIATNYVQPGAPAENVSVLLNND